MALIAVWVRIATPSRVGFGEESGCGGRGGTGHRAVLELEDRHLEPPFGGGGGDLEADEAGPHDCDRPRAPEAIAQVGRLSEGSQRDDAIEVHAGDLDGAVARAGCEYEVVVAQSGAVVERHATGIALDHARAAAGVELDRLLGEEGLGRRAVSCSESSPDSRPFERGGRS